MKRWAVSWFEGMPLSPQHLQAADRHLARRTGEAVDWFLPFSYGVRKIGLEIRNAEVALTECEARFRDGTTLAIPEDVRPDELKVELGSVLKAPGARVMIYLVVPNSGPERDHAEWFPCEDDNGEALVAEIQFRRPNASLLVVEGDEPPVGYQALPLARLGRSPLGKGEPMIFDQEYIPPLLAIEGWPSLARRLVTLADTLHNHVNRLASQLRNRTLVMNPNIPNDATRVLKLLAFNAVDAHLRATCATAGPHPWWVFLELCRIAGQVSTFRADRMLANLPEYNHEDLAGCFDAIIQEIEAGLLDEEPLPYDLFVFKRLLAAPEAPLEVPLRQNWLTEKRPIYLAVSCQLDADDCLRLLRKADLTIADSQQVERLHRGKRAGLDLKLPENPAPGLPSIPHQHFFDFVEVDKVWTQAFGTGALAIKLNPKHFQPRGDDAVIAAGGDERFQFKFSLCVFHTVR